MGAKLLYNFLCLYVHVSVCLYVRLSQIFVWELTLKPYNNNQGQGQGQPISLNICTYKIQTLTSEVNFDLGGQKEITKPCNTDCSVINHAIFSKIIFDLHGLFSKSTSTKFQLRSWERFSFLFFITDNLNHEKAPLLNYCIMEVSLHVITQDFYQPNSVIFLIFRIFSFNSKFSFAIFFIIS